MPARRRPWTVFLAAVLLAVPLALSGHVHAGHAGVDCAVCIVSHHMPTVGAAAPAMSAPVAMRSRVVATAPLAPASVARPVHAGRGPPALLASIPS